MPRVAEPQVRGEVQPITFSTQELGEFAKDDHMDELIKLMNTNDHKDYQVYDYRNDKNKGFQRSDFGQEYDDKYWRLRFFLLLVSSNQERTLALLERLRKMIQTYKAKMSNDDFDLRAQTIPLEPNAADGTEI